LNIIKVLKFFNIPWEIVEPGAPHLREVEGSYAILSSADCMAKVIQTVHKGEWPDWIRKASTIYVFGFKAGDQSTKLLQFLTGDPTANLRPIKGFETNVTITGSFLEMCGPLSGMRVPITLAEAGHVCDVQTEAPNVQTILHADGGTVFFAITCNGVRLFLNMWCRTTDVDALAPLYFDVKRSFFESVPLVLYLRWAFRSCTGCEEVNACLIVDDPPLKRRYGFLDFREALALMDRHNFTTTVAFIPWNWRRTDPETVRLFRERPERFSVVVHGCDHTTSEFAQTSAAVLNQKLRTALERIEGLRRRASIQTERVMVFPQGEFSPEAGFALKHNGFIAAVNTEVAPAQRTANQTRIADLWSMAIMRYGSFPIFTRRYPDHGIENFAFDALLGKPCLIASHHEIFKEHGRNLIDFISRLNALRWNLAWRPLSEVVRRSVTVERLGDGTDILRIFGGTSVFENLDGTAQKVIIQKLEDYPEMVENVYVNEAPIEFSVEGGFLRSQPVQIGGNRAVVRVVFRNDLGLAAKSHHSHSKIKVAAKRYLSEFRDNYLSQADLLYQSANWLRRRMSSTMSAGR
jgi:hypothetical protein